MPDDEDNVINFPPVMQTRLRAVLIDNINRWLSEMTFAQVEQAAIAVLEVRKRGD